MIPRTLHQSARRSLRLSPARSMAVAAVVVAGSIAAVQLHGRLGSQPILFAPTFPEAPALVTNEYATYNPTSSRAQRSATWIVTSGSLFARDGGAWSGFPDARPPDAASASGTGSSVFRVVTRRSDFRDVSIRMRLRLDGLVAPERSTHSWDGVHIFARYQSPVLLYVVSIARRDGHIVIKKKVPGTSSNGGTYTQLGREATLPFTPGRWHDVRLDVRNVDGGVRLTLLLDGHRALDTVDHGAGGPAITKPGRIGIRGDNAEFEFRDFTVRSA